MKKTNERKLRQELLAARRRLLDIGFNYPGDGNLSCRVGGDRVLLTPSGVTSSELAEKDLLLIDLSGRKIKGRGRPSGEWPIHQAVYQSRPEAQAVIHAHPPYCVALSLAGFGLEEPVLPELVVTLGAVPTISYATPSTDEGASAVRERIKHGDAVILARHGVLVLGNSPTDALAKLERLEGAARIIYLARQLGPLTPLSADQLSRLRLVADKYRQAGG